MSYAKSESRSTLIRHLRNELDEVKKSCEKYEELNGAMVALENNLKALKDDKEKEAEDFNLKCNELQGHIRECELLLGELKEENQEGERAATEAKNHMDRINSDVAFMDEKENALHDKLMNLGGFLDELKNNYDVLRDGTDTIKRELAEQKANLTAIEKEQLNFEEKISKMGLHKKTLLIELQDLETKEKRLAQLRTEREIERSNLDGLYGKKVAGLEELNRNLGQLEDHASTLDNERRRIREANTDVNNKVVEAEASINEMRAELNSLESKTMQVDDAYRAEEQEFIKTTDKLNDQKEKNITISREADKLKACLYGMEELCGKVGSTHCSCTCPLSS